MIIVDFEVFFFNYTATPEIYTYGHTLSLHDALPIFCRRRLTTSGCFSVYCDRSARSEASISTTRRSVSSGGPALKRSAGIVSGMLASRSEEHTSELQSLMRISSAVFCLKKKNTRKFMQ